MIIREKRTAMAMNFPLETMADVLKCCSAGSDVNAEIEFLVALSPQPVAAVDDKSGCLITMSDADIADNERILSSAASQRSCKFSSHKYAINNEDEETLDVDLGCGDLLHWNGSPATSSPTPPSLSSIPQSTQQLYGLSHCCEGKPELSVSHSVTHCKVLYPQADLSSLCQDCVLGERFVSYVFRRRFGLADSQHEENGEVCQQTLVDPQLEDILYKHLDAIIRRLLDMPLTSVLASSYCSLLFSASSMPNMRKRLVEHVMAWISRSRTVLDAPTYQHITTFVLRGLSDVWSVIRKASSTGLSRVFRDWTHSHQVQFFNTLLEVCINVDGSWQSKDGAVLCVQAIMQHCFSWSSANHKKVELPDYLVECVLTMVFSLISHPQLSIRETVANIMSLYMEHVDSQDMQELMQQTMTLLAPPADDKHCQETFHCVEAYAAEGLLNICTSIFKVLPLRKVVELWQCHHASFLAYLSHSASSVRQSTSTLLLHLATHRESSVVLTKLILTHLTRTWHVQPQSFSLSQLMQGVGDDDGVLTWEGKEGRLFVYELICKHLIDNHTAFIHAPNTAHRFQHLCSNDGGSEAGEWVQEAVHLSTKSLLTQLYLLDCPALLADGSGTQILTEVQTQNLQRWMLVHYTMMYTHHNMFHGCEEDHLLCLELLLPTGRDLLLSMLRHTALCLSHQQWELRRIAQQVLPQLCEVMCLYDVGLIMTVWGYMTEETNVQTFLGLCAFHYSLALCARVVAQVDLKDSTLNNPIYVGFVDGVRRHIGQYLPLLCSLLRRSTYDKISVMAAETALLALNFFELQYDMKEKLCSAVVGLWRSVFTFAHPKSAIATSLFPLLLHDFQSPYHGFLSCCLVAPDSSVQCAKQVEKSMMESVHRHLQHFVPQLSPRLSAHCLPLLAHNIGLFLQDTDTCKSLVNSFQTLCQCTKAWFSSMANSVTEEEDTEQSLKCLFFTVRELTAVIALKNLDAVLLQKILNAYLVVCASLQPELHIPFLLQGVAARMSDGESFEVEPGDCGLLDRELCWRRQLLPGYAQRSSVSAHHDDDSLDNNTYSEETESDVSLNASGSSMGHQLYGRSNRRRTLSTTDEILEIREVVAGITLAKDRSAEKEDEDDEDESDWDSWSEEEEDEEKSIVHRHFQDFFIKLGQIYANEGGTVLKVEIEKLSPKEQAVLHSIITRS